MSNSQEILASLKDLENGICESISASLSKAAGLPIQCSNALSSLTPAEGLESELNQPWLIVQFAFASSPQTAQILLLSQDHFLSFAQAFTGVPISAIDDAVITEVRPQLESIVAGLCGGIEQTQTEFKVSFEIFSLPANFSEGHIFRTNFALAGEDLSGTLVWLINGSTASEITGITIESEIVMPLVETWEPEPVRSVSRSLEILMDVPLEISVELGRMKLPVRDVIDLNAGSVVEIDKAAGEPVDVLVNGFPVAKGEVVVIEDSFGVRITEILSPDARIQRLSEAA